MSTPRLPWKRGPAAWGIARRRDEIIRQLQAARRNYFSLRQAAALLGVSTQPVRDWIRDGHLQPRGPRGQVPKAELVRLVSWLRAHAKHFNPQSYTRRLVRGRRSPAVPFATLAQAHFIWPKGRAALTPRELAGTDAAQGWQRLRELCADVVELRRGDHSAERLRLERLRLSRSGLPGENNPTPALDPAPRSA